MREGSRVRGGGSIQLKKAKNAESYNPRRFLLTFLAVHLPDC
jgi:hypothetical protein